VDGHGSFSSFFSQVLHKNQEKKEERGKRREERKKEYPS
jgi:hypothetical protein